MRIVRVFMVLCFFFLVLGLLERAASRTANDASGRTIGEEKICGIGEARAIRNATNRIGRTFGSGMNFDSHGQREDQLRHR